MEVSHLRKYSSNWRREGATQSLGVVTGGDKRLVEEVKS